MSVLTVVGIMVMIGALLTTNSVMPVEERVTLLSSVASNYSDKRFCIDPKHASCNIWSEFIDMRSGEVEVKMDTGAEVNVMPKKLLDKLLGKNYLLEPTPIVLEVYGGSLLRPMGTISIPNCKLNNRILTLEFVVADVESVPLLSLQACEDFGLVNRVTRTKNLHSIYKVYLCIGNV